MNIKIFLAVNVLLQTQKRPIYSSMPILQEDLQQLAELTKALTEENSGYVKDVRLINKFGEGKMVQDPYKFDLG